MNTLGFAKYVASAETFEDMEAVLIAHGDDSFRNMAKDYITLMGSHDTTIQSLKDENARAMAVIDELVKRVENAIHFIEGSMPMTAGDILTDALATAKAFKEKVGK